MTIYIVHPDAAINDIYQVPVWLGYFLRALAAVRRGWRAMRSSPGLGGISVVTTATALPLASVASPPAPASLSQSPVVEDVTSALVNLGMGRRKAAAAVDDVCRRFTGPLEFEAVLREAVGNGARFS